MRSYCSRCTKIFDDDDDDNCDEMFDDEYVIKVFLYDVNSAHRYGSGYDLEFYR